MISVEFKQLRYALAVLDHGSFTRAALQLGLETSALCRRITDLEVRLGVQLFERSARGAAPTPAGLAYLKEAREVLLRLDRAGDQARRLSRNAPPELTVGFIWSFARGQAARVIAAFGKEAPGVVIHLVEDGPMGLAQRLTRGEIDICITATPDPSDIVAERIGTLQQRRLWTEDLYVVAPRATPLEICSWDDLEDCTLLYRRVDAADRFAAWLAQAGGPALKFEAQDCTLDGLFTLVAAGIGWTLAPSSFVDEASETLRFIPIKSPWSTFEVIALWRGDEPNPVVQRFVDIALSVASVRS